ncbi:hypothetical protein BWI17_01500 [Betaproteobacteria bacterium GR16-43]|nr:hypothetical protein BWI17_01500 [Betaproteobacteria bacterium GR16-43]
MSDFEAFDNFLEVDRLQGLMLQALVLPAPRDAQSFARWLAQADLDALDPQAMRLVPALFRKFGGTMGDDPRRARMQGVYRRAHLRNTLLLADGRRVLAALRDAGIEFLLFKGIAMVLKYQADLATRTMADVDILVRPADVPRAEEILFGAGWTALHGAGWKRSEIHSRDFTNAHRSGFDLHWHALLESRRADADDGLWQRAERFDWNGLEVRLMSPEDLLFTGIVNGMRERDPLNVHWIQDLACILAAKPAIAWPTLWKEAARRGLRETLFEALVLACRMCGDLVDGAVLQRWLEIDPEFRRALEASLATQGRLHGLRRVDREGDEDRPLDSVSAAYVRFFLGEDGGIEGIFLQWRHLPCLPELFDVADPAWLASLVSRHPKTGEGYLAVPPGQLRPRSNPAHREYSARIALGDGLREIVLAPGGKRTIEVEVENDSSCCWVELVGSDMPFKVSSHLRSEDGSMLRLDGPRAPLTNARRGYAAFVEPGRKLTRGLSIEAPAEPGKYVVQLDVVHENVTWFSERGCGFPRLSLVVRPTALRGRFALAGAGILHAVFDAETVVIDGWGGAYYTFDGHGTSAWRALLAGHEAQHIVAAFEEAGVFDHAGGTPVERFLSALQDAGLIEAIDGEARVVEPLRVEPRFGAREPVLVCHGDLRGLVSMHPMRQASERGWPHSKA